MPQFGRPSTDTTVDNWIEDGVGDNAILWDEIDETVLDDADFVRTVLTPTLDIYVTKLTPLEDPISSTGHFLRTRYAKDAAGGAQIDLIVQLRQAYVSEGSQGTLIASRTFTNISNTFTTDAYTLVAAEADAITDYTNLYFRYSGNQV